jgi:plasmid maintenance system antidote protein VapI
MTRDLKPTAQDLWRLVEHYGSISHLARAIGVTRHEMEEWLDAKRDIPIEYYDALLALVTKLRK